MKQRLLGGFQYTLCLVEPWNEALAQEKDLIDDTSLVDQLAKAFKMAAARRGYQITGGSYWAGKGMFDFSIDEHISHSELEGILRPVTERLGTSVVIGLEEGLMNKAGYALNPVEEVKKYGVLAVSC